MSFSDWQYWIAYQASLQNSSISGQSSSPFIPAPVPVPAWHENQQPLQGLLPQQQQGLTQGLPQGLPQGWMQANNPPPNNYAIPFPQNFQPQSQPPSTSRRPRSPTRNKNGRASSPSNEMGKDKKKAQPSAESGGIPSPTAEYLLQASLPPFSLPYARNILVVIDLNGTLLYRPNRRRSPSSFVERPHARTFLSYCVNTFSVAIWSSARPANVARMCQQLLKPEDFERVVAVWGRDHFGLSPADYNERVQCYKRLSMLWADPVIAASHPEKAAGKRWSQRDTVLVDDSLEKGRSEPYNLIEIPEFSGDENDKDYILPQVHDYLNECSRQVDISTYIKNQPFRVTPGWELRPGPVEESK
ncbi:hypothetical protein AAE478_004235 [Parahypoxylon ruwenzoriense]